MLLGPVEFPDRGLRRQAEIEGAQPDPVEAARVLACSLRTEPVGMELQRDGTVCDSPEFRQHDDLGDQRSALTAIAQLVEASEHGRGSSRPHEFPRVFARSGEIGGLQVAVGLLERGEKIE